MANTTIFGSVAVVLAILVLAVLAGNVFGFYSNSASPQYTIKVTTLGFQYNSMFSHPYKGYIAMPKPGVLNVTQSGNTCNVEMIQSNLNYTSQLTYTVSFESPCAMRVVEAVIHYSGIGSLKYQGCQLSINGAKFENCVGQVVAPHDNVTFVNSVSAQGNYRGDVWFFLSNQNVVIY